MRDRAVCVPQLLWEKLRMKSTSVVEKQGYISRLLQLFGGKVRAPCVL